MNVDTLRSVLQQEAASARVSPEAQQRLQPLVRRRLRRRRGGQVTGLALLVVVLVATGLSVGSPSHRQPSASIDVTATPSIDVDTSTSGLALVLRSDGLHATTARGLTLLPDTQGARRLGQSSSGDYRSWLRTGGDGFQHAYVYNVLTGHVTDLGPAYAVAWATRADIVAVAGNGVSLSVPSKQPDGSVTFPLHRVVEALSDSLLWQPDGLDLAANTNQKMQIVHVPNDLDLENATIRTLTTTAQGTIPAAWLPNASQAILAWPNPGNGSSADGLPLGEFGLRDQLDPPEIARSTLTYRDWIDVDGDGAIAITGGDRVAAHGKELTTVGHPDHPAVPPQEPGTTTTSFAFSPDRHIARVIVPTSDSGALPTRGQVVVSLADGTGATTVPGITDARAVERAPGGFLIIGIDRLHEVNDDGSVRDLGPVDTSTNDYYGHVDARDVVLPTLD